MGYIEAQDGAADLLAVIPTGKAGAEMAAADEKRPSLNLMIQDAAKRKGEKPYF